MKVTAQDEHHASRLLIAFKAANKQVIAEELAFIREDAIRCAMIRIEREFNLVSSKDLAHLPKKKRNARKS